MRIGDSQGFGSRFWPSLPVFRMQGIRYTPGLFHANEGDVRWVLVT